MLLAAAVSTPETYYVGSWACREGSVAFGLELAADGSGELMVPPREGKFRYGRDEKDSTSLTLWLGDQLVPFSVDDLTPGSPDTGFPVLAETMEIHLAGLPFACIRVRTGV